MEVQFNKNVTYKSRVGSNVTIEITHRTQSYAVVEVIDEESDSPYPVLIKQLIQRSDDGREFIDLCSTDSDGQLCYSRVWATDVTR